jgi:hypothetical protein
MVEVDPLILIAAGAAFIGVASILMCTVKPTPVVQEKSLPEVTKPKKKSRSKSNNKSKTKRQDSNIVEEDDDREIVVLKVDEEVTVTVEEVESSPVPEQEDDDDTKSEDQLPVQAKIDNASVDTGKKKKAKETPEQKAARLERQKKNDKQTSSATSALQEDIEIPEDDSIAASWSHGTQNGNTPQFDGWAVVEDKRKNKAKKDPEPEEKPEKVEKNGKAAAVVAAAAEESVATPPAPAVVVDSVTTQLSIDAKKLGLLIGPKGATKIGIQSATGVEIEMPRTEKDFTGPVTITITGPALGVGRATAAVHELCSKGYSMLLAGPDFQEGYLVVHQKYVDFVLISLP